MSYCHLTSYGINFNNGFGLHPGNRIRDRVMNASCIAGGGTSAPSTLSASDVTSNSATLNWAAVSGATNYTAQYRVSGSGTWSAAGSTAGTSLTVSGLTASTSYSWSVKSDCSAYSAESSFTTTGTGPVGCPSPAGLTTSNITQTTATISWTAVAGALSYTVQYKPSASGSWNSLNVSTTSTALSGLTAGTSYDWQVKADCSPYSSPVSFISTSTTPPLSCATPAGLSESNITSATARLNWAASTNAVSYSVKIRQAGTGKWTNYNNVTGNFVNVSGLKRARQYEWVIQANCGVGITSPLSNTKTFNTQ